MFHKVARKENSTFFEVPKTRLKVEGTILSYLHNAEWLVHSWQSQSSFEPTNHGLASMIQCQYLLVSGTLSLTLSLSLVVGQTSFTHKLEKAILLELRVLLSQDRCVQQWFL